MRHIILVLFLIGMLFSCKKKSNSDQPSDSENILFSSVELFRYNVSGGNLDSIKLSTSINKLYDSIGNVTKSIYYNADGDIMMQFINEYNENGLKSRVNWKNKKDSVVRYVKLTYDDNKRLARSEAFNPKNEFVSGFIHNWKDEGRVEEKGPILEGKEFKPNAIYFYNDKEEYEMLHEFDENDSLYYIAKWKYLKADSHNNWTERIMITRDTIRRLEKRTINYQ